MKHTNKASSLDQTFYSDFPTGDRFKVFQNLMRFRIREILLVSSQYNLFLLEEDGRIYEFLRKEYYQLNLSHSPEIVRVSSGNDALKLLNNENRFDLVITTTHSTDTGPSDFALKVKEINSELPIVMLVFDSSEFNPRLESSAQNNYDRIFTWNGDFRIIISIIKLIEDARNARHDVDLGGIQVILVVEDNIRFYSAYLPLLYSELLQQSQTLIEQGINLYHKFLRMRARPKILLATNYEEACQYFDDYEEHILGVISDVNYMRDGRRDQQAGLHLANYIKSRKSDIPILLQSHDSANEEKAFQAGASFLHKDSKHLLHGIQSFALENLGFGDFVFKLENGDEVARANDLAGLKKALETIPGESVKFHADRNHFSNWLKARREFWLAYKLRPQKVSDYVNSEDLRRDLVNSLELYTRMQQRGILIDFNKDNFDPDYGFSRIGSGSIGGKARGLSFLNLLVSTNDLHIKFKNVVIKVPAALILGTNVFEQFMKQNDLFSRALDFADDNELIDTFKNGDFPEEMTVSLRDYLQIIKKPIAIRSSSLLEDSQYFPFAGVYNTVMLANNEPDLDTRLHRLLQAIKMVYASTYSQKARNYMQHTSYRLEEERMAIVIQSLVGNSYKGRFYPEISGVAKSYNYYVIAPQKSDDGVVSVALGLGKTVVEGGNNISFSPKFPKHIPQLSSVDQALQNNQDAFYAINLSDNKTNPDDTKRFMVYSAEEDGSLIYSASTYVPDNHAIYDGTSRSGQRLITMAPILKQDIFPLPEIISAILDLGKKGMGNDIEIEFAIRFSKDPNQPDEFSLLQMRPVATKHHDVRVSFSHEIKPSTLCYSSQVLGNGIVDEIADIIVVNQKTFDRSKTVLIAEEIDYLNQKLESAQKPYLLITLGRLGSSDPWLGVPLSWEQISGVKAVIESGLKEMSIEPSQASHFFQNISSFNIGYFTINPNNPDHYLNWDWIESKQKTESLKYVNHLQLEKPLNVIINGRNNDGVIKLNDQ
ncbi:MAG: histidine kinase [Calditrichaeota bacterium]|nr:histidine kinase [Calditrichota bacterium]